MSDSETEAMKIYSALEHGKMSVAVRATHVQCAWILQGGGAVLPVVQGLDW